MNTAPQPYPFDILSSRPGFLDQSGPAADWCARGFGWLYAFNPEEAGHCFGAAAAEDDSMALAWWGIAIANGPFMNMPWDWFTADEVACALPVCHDAIQKAVARRDASPAVTGPLVGALIEALAHRFPSPQVPDGEGLDAWEHDYADAMTSVYGRFGDDPDVAALYVEAQIMLTPWAVYDVESRAANPKGRAELIHDALDRGLAGYGASHAGLLHYDIHVSEMSPTPQRALASARRLEDVAARDAGHLHHMPAHIHALIGDYDSAARCSRRAVATDLTFRSCLSRAPFYRTLHCHDAHMLMFAGMQLGNFGDASNGARVMSELLDEVLVAPPATHMMMTLEGYLSTIPHVDIRFGRWQAIANRAFDGDPRCRPASWAMHHYARAVACAALGDADAARDAADAFAKARACVPADYTFSNNPAARILAVADLMMRGELAYHEGRVEAAFELLRRAAAAEDSLAYNEPRAWMHPPRHALGALLLEQGRISEAARVYEIDLGRDDTLPISRQNRGNIWSLHGLHECWRRLGDDRADDIGAELDAVLPFADRPITSSCCCRQPAGCCAS